MTVAALIVTVIIVYHCPCINTICLHKEQTGIVSPWFVWQFDVTAAVLVVTVTIVFYCPCINIIYLHTDSSAGSVEGHTGIVSI